MKRGEIWWTNLPDPAGSGPGFRRPMIVLQANEFNKSLINTVIVIVITSNLKLANAPGNVLLTVKNTHLPRESVANISQLMTIDKSLLVKRVSILSANIMDQIEKGIKLVLGLP